MIGNRNVYGVVISAGRQADLQLRKRHLDKLSKSVPRIAGFLLLSRNPNITGGGLG
jgi:hypothetical protein